MGIAAQPLLGPNRGYTSRSFDDVHAASLRVPRKRSNRFKVRTRLQSSLEVRWLNGPLERSMAPHDRRSTLDSPHRSARMPIDQGLTFIIPAGDWSRLERQCILEIKGLGRVLPCDRLLWRNGYRPVAASKFALGVSLLDPSLPDNRWHRLRGQLAPLLTSGELADGCTPPMLQVRAAA